MVEVLPEKASSVMVRPFISPTSIPSFLAAIKNGSRASGEGQEVRPIEFERVAEVYSVTLENPFNRKHNGITVVIKIIFV